MKQSNLVMAPLPEAASASPGAGSALLEAALTTGCHYTDIAVERPHAALLFVDFMLSPEGQELIHKRNRVPASTAVPTNLNKFPFHMIDPVVVLDESEKWEKLYSELFLKGQAIQREKD